MDSENFSENEIIDSEEVGESLARRRHLLPIWVRIFIWIFLVFGVFTLPILLIASAGNGVYLSAFGLSTTDAFSLTGLIILSIYFANGVVAFMMWFEKKKAIHVAQIVAVILFLFSAYMMFFSHAGTIGFTIRFELILVNPMPSCF
ncbi:MAG: hypothetical protein R2852_02020 [Bacteroidia bacterium]